MSASAESVACSDSKNAGVGSQSPMSRCATTAGSTPWTLPRARVTSCCETPTRKAPLMSLFQTNRCGRSIARQAPRTASRCASSPALRSVSSVPSTQSRSGTSLDRSGGGSSSAIVSATSPTASYDSWKSQSGTPASSAAQTRSFPDGTACRGFLPIRK